MSCINRFAQLSLAYTYTQYINFTIESITLHFLIYIRSFQSKSFSTSVPTYSTCIYIASAMYSAGMVPGSAYPGRGLHRPGTRNATFQNYSHFYGVNSCGQ